MKLNRAYPTIAFEINISDYEYKLLEKISKLENEDDHTQYMMIYMQKIRRLIEESKDKELNNVIDNYMGLSIKDGNTVVVVVFDEKKKDINDYKEIKFEKGEYGYIPYILKNN